jgi:2-keto-4-pentenoate hydratase/2-oxohepta-3-ene-1,7-dioic acid hydratase in catechol pathway
MKLANLDGRATLVAESCGIDVATATGGEFGPGIQSIYDDWAGFSALVPRLDLGTGSPIVEAKLGPPAPAPRQVFAIGLNYRSHAEETRMERIGTIRNRLGAPNG